MPKIHKINRDLLTDLVWTEYLPIDVEPISVGVQEDRLPIISIWYKFSRVDKTIPVTFVAVETGKVVVLDGMTFLGTATMLKGTYVVHVFYKIGRR